MRGWRRRKEWVVEEVVLGWGDTVGDGAKRLHLMQTLTQSLRSLDVFTAGSNLGCQQP